MSTSGAVKKERKQNKAKNFFRGVWTELKKVHWPNKKQIVIYTGVVLLTIAVVSFALFLIDSILDIPMNLLFR